MPELNDLLPMLGLIAVIGAFAGIIAGLLGVGGGIFLVPTFFFAFERLGYTTPDLMQICLATSLATIVVTSVRSLLSHNRKGAVDWSILKGWGPGIAIGAGLGVIAATGLRSEVLMAIFGILGVTVGLYLAFGRETWRLGDAMPKGVGRAVTSPVIGFLSVLMGIGGGSFGVPLMTLYGVAIHRAVATAAGFGVIIAVPGVIGFLLVQGQGPDRPPFTIGQVNLVAFAVVVAMTLPDRAHRRAACPCDGPRAAAPHLRGLRDGHGAQHAAQGGGLVSWLARGWQVFDAEPAVAAWLDTAGPEAIRASRDPGCGSHWLRHRGTWFVGVDVLAQRGGWRGGGGSAAREVRALAEAEAVTGPCRSTPRRSP
jgi:uncharacterized membrane protein YfcA